MKMVHNGIEYGMMQSLAEGFEIMNASEFELDLRSWRPLAARLGRSRLAARAARACLRGGSRSRRDPRLRGGLGRRPLDGQAAIDERVPAPAIALALFSRFASRQDESFAAKVNAALRNQFGGHAVQSADKPE